MKAIVVVGVPIDSLGKPGGTDLSPGVLREQGIVDARDARDLPVRIVGGERDPAELAAPLARHPARARVLDTEPARAAS